MKFWKPCRNMDPLVHTRDQGTVETVDFSLRTRSEKGEDCPIGRKGDGHRFLGFTRCDLHGLPGEGQNGHRAVLLRKIRTHLAKKKVLFHHDNAPDHTSSLAKANWSNWATNCYPIHHHFQIWPRVTSFCFQT